MHTVSRSFSKIHFYYFNYVWVCVSDVGMHTISASVEQAGEIRSPELKVDSCEPTEAGAEN